MVREGFSRIISDSIYSGHQVCALGRIQRAVKAHEAYLSLALYRNLFQLILILVFNSASSFSSVLWLQSTLVFPQQVADNTHFSQ